jgi:hypothetical protein
LIMVIISLIDVGGFMHFWSKKIIKLSTTVNYNNKLEQGKYHCTIDLLFDWFGSVCFAK